MLHAGPEARRALIEEAAGVLKHRRRKEKALRKLEAMQANLTRLVDLTAELGRRLKPLGRQAEMARRAAVIQADLRDSRLRLLADDYLTLATRLEADEADEAAVLARRTALETALGQARQREAELDAAAQQHAVRAGPGPGDLVRAFFAGRAAAGHRGPGRRTAPASVGRAGGRAARPRSRRAGSPGRRAARGRGQPAGPAGGGPGPPHRRGQRALRGRGRAGRASSGASPTPEGPRRPGPTGWPGCAARSARPAAARPPRPRSWSGWSPRPPRPGPGPSGPSRSTIRSRSRCPGTTRAGPSSPPPTRRRGALLAAASAQVSELRRAEAEATRRYTALRARVETLQEAFRRGADASADLLADTGQTGSAGRFSGIIGPFAEAITIADGAQVAIAAALGAAANAVAVTDLNAAIAVLTVLRESGAGTAGLVIAGHPDVGHSVASRSRSRTDRADLPAGARYALDLVQATDELRPAVTQLLGGVVVAASLEQAADLTRATPGLRVVTRDGDVLGAHWAIGGSAGQQSLLEVRAAADDAATGLQEAQDQCENAAERLAVALSAESAARLAVDEARARMRQADSGAAEISGRLGRLAGAARAAGDEVRRLETAIETAQRAGEKDRARLAELTGQLTEAENSAEAADPDGPDPDGAGQDGAEADPSGAAAIKDTLAQRCTMARNAEMEARLEVRTVEERLRAIEGRADALNSAATAERQARERAQARLRQRAADAAVARAVARGAQLATARAEQSLEAALARRTEAEHATAEGADELKVVRARVRDLAAELDTVVSSAHGAEIARAEHRLRLEQLEAHAVEEFGVQAAELVADYGPAVPIPPPADAEEGTLPTAYDRAIQERRAAAAQRDLDKLGKVNPLALEEYAALQERHTFLATQLEDLKKTRRDLLTVVKEVDDRVQEVFASAYADTAREFEHIFSRLFPGGQGRLVLTEPDDMLATGIEVEARPPGKKVKRLSLLSGGERSLTAIAYLCAIFKARPSPFYVLDEVEAALDDTNLQRLLAIFTELRESSQLIVVTHQRRTMECADALYGVSMRGDGVSAVVSQRLTEREPA